MKPRRPSQSAITLVGARCAIALLISAAASACSDGGRDSIDGGALGLPGADTVRLRDGGEGDAASDGGDGVAAGSDSAAGMPGAGTGSDAASAGTRGGDQPRAGAGGKHGSAGSSANASGAGGTQAGAGDTASSSGAGGVEAGSGGMAAAGSGGTLADEPCYDRWPGVLFCDDFESPELDGWTRYGEGPDGRTEFTRAAVHGGGGALDSVKVDPGDGTPLYRDLLGQRTQGHLYLRTFLRVPSSVVIAPAGSRASLLVLGEDSGQLGGISLVLWENDLSLTINGQVASEVKARFDLPRDRWVCVQIDFEIGASAMARLRIDGVTLAEGMRNTLMPTAYERLWVGVNWIAPEQTADVRALYDDLVVDTRNVPCSP